ncbi:LysR family transcriptional regulator [Acetonema longum]|uniref:LysR family transcriptional regulator n=1 Tax=Acetonema longum DSM 6540 TaxID=1009370 RepID=F7NN97_9FIRM|nr:LysR family transcriptional regulator [Acetonema longum]EGO62482.1 LysR family transcriptional regulator [Acetonema longum DSM 6540]
MFKGKEYIYEVYKEKSFTKAAQNLYISQPALSAAIKKIENRIGCSIFDRSSKAVRLTDAGAEYIKAAETIMDIENRFENYLSNLNQLKTGRLSIGASNVFASFIVPAIITAFNDKYPAIKVTLIEAASARLEELLFAGTLDFVLDNYPLDETIYEKHLFCSENLILTVPPKLLSNHLAREYQLSIDDICQGKHLDPATKAVPFSIFAHEPFIFLRAGNDTRIRADKVFQENGLIPKIVLELDQLATAYNVACYGMGAAIISDTLAQKANRNSTMLYYKINSPHTFRNVFFYNKQNKYITKAMEEFVRIAPKTVIGTVTSHL